MAIKVGVLFSGTGSNFEALAKSCAAPDSAAKIMLAISNRADAGGLTIAEKYGIASLVIDHKDFAHREDFDAKLDKAFTQANIELICAAGFLRLLTKGFVEKWQDKIINIHPSLLPNYKGLDVHRRVLEAGEKESGCTVHFMRAEMDEGPIIAQAKVKIETGDTPETLAARVLEAEHRIYPAALQAVARGEKKIA